MTFSLINRRVLEDTKVRVGVEAVFIYIILAFSLLSFPLISTEGFCPDQRAFQARGSFFPKNTRELPGISYMGDNLLCSSASNQTKTTMLPGEPRVVEASDSKLPALSLPSPPRQPWSFKRKKTKEAKAFSCLLSFFFLETMRAVMLWKFDF